MFPYTTKGFWGVPVGLAESYLWQLLGSHEGCIGHCLSALATNPLLPCMAAPRLWWTQLRVQVTWEPSGA